MITNKKRVNMLSKITKISVVTGLMISISFGAGIPVVDAAANAQMTAQNLKQIAEWVKEADRWVETTTQYTKVLDSYAKELATKSGIRDSVQFIKEAKDIYDEAEKLGKKISDIDILSSGAINSKLKALIDKYFEYSCDELGGTKKIVDSCNQSRVNTVAELDFYNDRSKAISKYTKDINRLAGELKKSKDIKESTDINNAIQTKVALMEAEKIQIDLYTSQREKFRELQQKQIDEESKKIWSSGDLDFSGFDYNFK